VAVPFQDREEQHSFGDVHGRVQQHQECPEDEQCPERCKRAQEVRPCHQGGHQRQAAAGDDEAGQEEGPEDS